MRLKLAEEEMKFLGISGCNGVKWILKVLADKKEFYKLTSEQHQEIVDAWNSRNSMPASAHRRYVPEITKGENCTKSAEKIIGFFAKTLVA